MWHEFIDAIMVYDFISVFQVTPVPVPILSIRVQFYAYTYGVHVNCA